MPSEDDLVGMKSQTGIRNIEYGVWKSRCCGDEIVLYRGAIFPMCHRHRGLLTEWILISTTLFGKPRVSPALFQNPHIPIARLKELSTEGVVSSEVECDHLTGCRACRSQLESLARDYHRRSLDDSDKKSA